MFFNKKAKQNVINNYVNENINDRHYWKAEYNDTVNNQTIACPFEK